MENKNFDKLWHSSSHILALAVKKLYPEVKFAIGPSIENGFYYDFDNLVINEEDLIKIENEMKKIASSGIKFERFELSREEALKKFSGQPYKIELIRELPEGEIISYYRSGEFEDLCRGPHIESSNEIKAVKLISIAGAYWKGDSNNKMLTRIYGISFPSQELMDEYINMIEEAKRRDHRLIGKNLDLYSFHPEAPGSVFWHDKGWTLRNIIIEHWRKVHKKYGYKEINTPIILDRKLWEQSGHWQLYKENMYVTQIDERDFAIKPMSCPGAMLYYSESAKSYREFPLKVAELGLVHRHELSGTLHGLMRVRQFTQDDAHIFIYQEMLEKQLAEVMDMAIKMLGDFGFKDFRVSVSVRSEKKKEKYLGSDEIWEKAENAIKNALVELKLPYVIMEGEAKFYGPSADILIKDSIGREWQCSTIQLDFNLPQRFNLEYMDSNGEKKVPVMLHRTLLGSLERFIGVLIEHYAGALPVWLSPVQAMIIPIGERNLEYAKALAEEMEDENIRVEVSGIDESFNKRLRNNITQKIPHIIIIGDKEMSEEKVALRKYGSNDTEVYSKEEYIRKIKQEIKNKV